MEVRSEFETTINLHIRLSETEARAIKRAVAKIAESTSRSQDYDDFVEVDDIKVLRALAGAISNV